MGDVSTVGLLQQNALFQDLTPDVLDQVASAVLCRKYKKGRILFSKGNPSDALYCVVSGRVRISVVDQAGHEVFLNIMRTGDAFGEVGLIDGLARTATAIVVLPSSLLVIPRDVFLFHLHQEPQLALKLLNELCRRLRLSFDLIEDCVFLTGEARVAKQLVSLSAVNGRKLESGATELYLSQADLSHFLGISRQMVNQYLQDWSAAGWVKLHRGRIAITSLADLRRVAKRTD